MRYLHSRHNSKLTLSSEEIQHISQTISETYHPLKFSQAEPLNFPQLILLPIDPYHLHAYWNVFRPVSQTRERDESPLTLRLFWQFDFAGTHDSNRSWFDVGEVYEQADAKIKLPVAGAIYTAAIGHCDNKGGFLVHASSQPVCMPACAMITVAPIQTKHSMPWIFDEAEIDSKIRKTLSEQDAETSSTSTSQSYIFAKPGEPFELKVLDNHSSVGAAYLQSSACTRLGN